MKVNDEIKYKRNKVVVGSHWNKHWFLFHHYLVGYYHPLKARLTVPCLSLYYFKQSLQPFPPWLFFAPAPVSAVPSAVQMASLVSEDPHHQTPHTPDTVAPTDLNETATELADWLLLITQMLKSNIVTVGDTEDIRTTMGRLQVRGWGMSGLCFCDAIVHIMKIELPKIILWVIQFV